jgi:hypothetical protein
MKIQTQVKAGGINVNHNQTQVRLVEGQRIDHNQTEVRTVEKPGSCPFDAGAAGGGAVAPSDSEVGGAGTGNQAEPQLDPGTPEGFGVNHNQTLVRTVEGITYNHNQTLVRTAS